MFAANSDDELVGFLIFIFFFFSPTLAGEWKADSRGKEKEL